MKVLVTGGAGHIGKGTTARLVRSGWDVRMIGLETEAEIPGAEFITCDILNYDDLRQQMRGCQAVVHLAAIPQPKIASGRKVFEVNAAGTFNVFEAAAVEGIRHIVQASSINALGAAYSLTDISPKYFPVDEDHPTFTTDPYSFSKEIVEDIGRYYWRRDGISSVALRFPGVYPAEWVQSADVYQKRQAMRDVLDELAALPETERRQQLADVRQQVLAFRQKRPMEFREVAAEASVQGITEDPLWYAYAFDRFNLWVNIDERDAAQAIEKGLTADYEGAHALFINDIHNWLCYDSMALVRFFFPEVSASDITLSGSAALVSIDKARKLIGFEPEYSVETWDKLPARKKPHDQDR